MARQKAPKQEVAITKPSDIIPFDSVPDYLKDQAQSGLESLGKDDFKIPRIKLLQALNPEIQSFKGEAIPGEFWHTGANISLGSEFKFVPIVAGKRVILWDPNDGNQDGGIIAFSKNAKDWISGGNTKHKVKLKGVSEDVVWDTGKNVPSSGLLEWGSSNPEDNNSAPAAQLTYEYLCYLPDNPMLSPCLLGLFRTALPNAKQFNTSLFMLRRPTTSVVVRCFADEKTEGKRAWFVPQFKTIGWAPESLFNTCKEYQDKYQDYNADYNKDEAKENIEADKDNSY